MKKLLPYILILVIFTGILNPIKKVYASAYSDCVASSAGQGADVSLCKGLEGDPSKTTTNTTTYTFLAPLPGVGNTFNAAGEGGSGLGAYLNIIINLFIGICAVLAVIMIVMGGIQYMTSELMSSKEEGRHRISGAIFGLLLALGAWLILNTINPALLNNDLSSLKKATVSVSLDAPQKLGADGKTYPDGSVFGTIWSGTPPTFNRPVNTNPSGDCATVGQPSCTSLKGLDPRIVNNIESNCSTCNLTITGGTESWLHSVNSSHRPGSATIDLSATSDINTYITGSGTFPNDGKVYSKNGVNYLAEKAGQTAGTTAAHWHAY